MTQKEAKKCRALTYESWETVEFIDDLHLPGLSSVSWPASLTILSVPVFFPQSSSSYPPPLPHTPTLPPILPLREKSGPRRRQDGGYILLLKYVNENVVSRAKMGLFCIFVDDHNTFLNIWINKLFEKWRFWWVLLLNLFNFLAPISVKLSLNHVLLWDNLKGNAKRNSFEFRRITPVNKKQKIL